MIRITIDVKTLLLRDRQCLISYLYRETSADYVFICDTFNIAQSTAYSYRYKGDRMRNEEIDNRFRQIVIEELVEEIAEELPEVEVIETLSEESFCIGRVVYDNPNLHCRKGVELAYISEIYNNDVLLFLKIGKTNDIQGRMNSHAKNEKYGGNRAVVKKVFVFDNEDDSYTMENYLRKYYKGIFEKDCFVPRDRFSKKSFDITRDTEYFERIYDTILELGRE